MKLKFAQMSGEGGYCTKMAGLFALDFVAEWKEQKTYNFAGKIRMKHEFDAKF
jgi:hypothetical protein